MRKIYDDLFKKVVVEDIINKHLPIKAAVRKYSIDRETVRKWLRDARPDIYAKQVPEIKRSEIDIATLSYEDLLLQNEMLRFENEALKKLGTLIPQRGNKK